MVQLVSSLVGWLVGVLLLSGLRADSSSPFPTDEAWCDQREDWTKSEQMPHGGRSTDHSAFSQSTTRVLWFYFCNIPLPKRQKEGVSFHDVWLLIRSHLLKISPSLLRPSSPGDSASLQVEAPAPGASVVCKHSSPALREVYGASVTIRDPSFRADRSILPPN